MNYRDPELRKKLANEYVLGTMRHGAARRFEQLMQDDDSLSELVDEIQLGLSSLVESLPPEKPSEQVWARIEQKLFKNSSPSIQHVRTSLTASNSWKNTFFKGWAVAASLALIVVSWQLWSEDTSSVIAQQYASVLNSEETKQAAWLLTINPQSRQIIASSIQPQVIGANQAFELWVKTPRSESVQSVGLIPADGRQVLQIDEQLASAISESEFFGVSVEPLDGSPTGQPTTTPTYLGSLIASGG